MFSVFKIFIFFGSWTIDDTMSYFWFKDRGTQPVHCVDYTSS